MSLTMWLFQVFSKYGGAITIDFWTDDYQKNAFLAITGHFINDCWQLKSILIGIYPWDAEKRQTGENIRTFMLEVSIVLEFIVRHKMQELPP